MCFFRSMILLRGWKDSIATNIYLIKHNVLTMCFLHYTASLPYTFFLDFLIPTFISFIIVTRNLNTACWFVNRPTQLHLRMVHPLSRCELSVKHDHCTDSFGRELTITMFIVIVMTLTQPCMSYVKYPILPRIQLLFSQYVTVYFIRQAHSVGFSTLCLRHRTIEW